MRLVSEQISALALSSCSHSMASNNDSGYEFNDVINAFGVLTKKEMSVIKMRFGLGDCGSFTLTGIAKALGYTTERIRQIEGKALRKLRKHIMKTDLKSVNAFNRSMFKKRYGNILRYDPSILHYCPLP